MAISNKTQIKVNDYNDKETRNALYKKAAKLWGTNAQLEMLLEESIELALATRKFLRNVTEDRTSNLCSEIADVKIMIEQFENMFPDLTENIEQWKAFKLTRLEQRISENKFE